MSVPERQLRRGGEKSGVVQSQSPRVAQIGRVPVTPRLATSGATPSSSRKTTSLESPQTKYQDGDEFSTPVLASIASNVTPRSSARQQRGRGQGTPSAKTSPNAVHFSPSLRKSETQFDGFKIQSPIAGSDVSSPSTLASSQVEAFRYPRASSVRPESSDGQKFFRADTRPDSGEGLRSFRSDLSDNGKFFRAGQTPGAPPGHSLTKSTTLPTGPTFFYANEVSSAAASTPTLSGKQEDVVSGPRLATRHRKAASVVLDSPPKANRLPYQTDIGDRPLPRIAPSGHVRGASISPQSSRRGSLSPENLLHIMNGPMPSLFDRKDSGTSTENATEAVSNLSLFNIPNPPSPEVPYDAGIDDNASSASSVAPSRPRLGLASAPIVPKEDFAANARRERKLLDLEISNNSLLAINRSLEREMRKQHAELRRYKRLSRSGRLSLTPAKEALANPQPAEISEESSSDESELSESDDDALDTSVIDNALQDVALRRAARDEKRVRADLEKHKELLVASQLMNQSLKRCLTWTDELIRQGKRALEHSVRLSEIGGRVLSPEELEDSLPNDDFFSSVPSEKILSLKERDSGIDM